MPVLPRSLVAICTDAAPLWSALGAKISPSMALFTSLIVPVNVTVASAVPSPTLKVSPVRSASVTVPLVPVSVT